MGPGGGTHHCSVCRMPAKTRCLKLGHLEVCDKCGQAWSLKHNKSCPYCGNKEAKEEQSEEKKKGKKDKEDPKDPKDKNKDKEDKEDTEDPVVDDADEVAA